MTSLAYVAGITSYRNAIIIIGNQSQAAYEKLTITAR